MNAGVFGSIAGLALGAGVAGAVGALLARVAAVAGEIERYSVAIAGATDGIAENLVVTDVLTRTGELAGALPALVRAGAAE